jgi:hypothetical protein
MRVRAETVRGRGRESCQRHRVLGRDDILAGAAKEFAEWGGKSDIPSLEAYARQFEEAIEKIRLSHRSFRELGGR